MLGQRRSISSQYSIDRREFNMLGVLTLCLVLSVTLAFPNGYYNGYRNWYNNGNGYGYGNFYGYNNGFGNGYDRQYEFMNFGNNEDWCDNGWQMYNDHYYCFNRRSMSWNEARDSCRSMGSYLVQIENMDENMWLYNTAGSGYNYWMGAYCMGGSCMSSNDEWSYNGNDNSMMSYFNWGEGGDNFRNNNFEGYNGGYCGMFNCNNGGQWWRYMCPRRMMYICEREGQYGFGK